MRNGNFFCLSWSLDFSNRKSYRYSYNSLSSSFPTYFRERRQVEARAAGEAERGSMIEDNAIQKMGSSFWATEDGERDLDIFGNERTDIGKRIFVAPDLEEMGSQGDRIVEVVAPEAENIPDLMNECLTDDQQLQDKINIRSLHISDSSSEPQPEGPIRQDPLELIQTLTNREHLGSFAEHVEGNDITSIEDVTLDIMANTHHA